MKRREFLKVFGGAVGGAILLSCGGGGGGAILGAPMPNGYRFFSLHKVGDGLPAGGTSDSLPGTVMINDNSEILFTARESNEAMGVYELTMDYTTETPAVERQRTLVRDGDILNDGTEVGDVGIGSTNKLGYYATPIVSASGVKSIYMERDKGGLDPVVKGFDKLPGNEGQFGASFGDLELDDTNSIIIVSHYSPENGSRPNEGLFYLCGGVVSEAGKLLASSGDLLPESSTTVGRMGLVDMGNEDGNFVAQIYCGISGIEAARAGVPPSLTASTALIGGSIFDEPRRKARLLAAARPLTISRAAEGQALRGDIYYGPRIGSSSKVAQVVHTSAESLTLYFDGNEVASTGGLSPKGNSIQSFSGPVVGHDGLLYFVMVTDGGEELCIHNGSTTITVLSRGDKPDGDEGQAIISIEFGVVRDVVDRQGRLVFKGTFEDGTSSVVLGIPV